MKSLIPCLFSAVLICAMPGRAADAVAPAPATAVVAAVTPVEESIAKIQKTITARIEQANAGETIPNRFDWTTVESELAQIKSQTLSSNGNDAKNAVRNLIRRVKSDELKQLLEELVVAIDDQKAAELARRRQKMLAELTEITLTALKAETAAVIDPLFDRLTAMQEDIGANYDAGLNRIQNQINQSQNFLRQWQDLVDNIASGDKQQARQLLNNFRNSYSMPAGVSRSEFRDHVNKLRARLGGDSSMAAIVSKITLDHLAEAQQQLLDGSDYGWNQDQNERNSLVANLDVFIMANEALRAGNTDESLHILRNRSFIYGGTRNSQAYPMINRLRNEWIIKSLPALTGLTDLPPAKKDETGGVYVQRLLFEADGKSDWSRAKSFAHVAEFLESPVMPGYGGGQGAPAKGSMELAISLYQRGLIMEEAAQPKTAAELYRDALKQGAPAKLQAWLIKRLQEISAKEG